MCEKNTLIIYCPECGNQMNVDTNKNAVTCNCCGTSFLVKYLVNGNLKKDLNFNNDDLLLNQAAYISDPAGGLIYLDNFILKYEIAIQQIRSMSVCLIYRASSKTNCLCYHDACSLIETMAIYVTECKDQTISNCSEPLGPYLLHVT